MPYTINLHLLDNKQIKVDKGGIPLGNENSYRIYEHEENVTQFEIVSKPAEYENADYYVIFINSQNKRAFLNDIIPDPVTDDGQLIVDDTFMLPVGMMVKGYGYIRIYAIKDDERVEFQPIKIKVWNTVETWKDYVTELSTPASQGWVEQYVDNTLAEINGKIPAAASSSNKLVDNATMQNALQGKQDKQPLVATFTIPANSSVTVKPKYLVGLTTINWGDGTRETKNDSDGTQFYEHEYVNETENAISYNAEFNGVIAIGRGNESGQGFAFAEITSLTKVIIPSSVIIVYLGAFRLCTNLAKIEIQDGVQHIGLNAFEGCAIKDIYFPDSIKTIDNYACQSCTELLTARIGSNMYSFGGSVFYGCTSLKVVRIENAIPPELNNPTVFPSGTIIIVPSAAFSAYQNAGGNWTYFTANLAYVLNSSMVENTPTANSTKLVTSGGVYTAIQAAIDIAQGKTNGYGITLSDNNSFNSTLEPLILPVATVITLVDGSTITAGDLKVGDTVYINGGSVPDRWVASKTATDVYFYAFDSKLDLSGYVQKTTTIAGIDLQNDITAQALTDALIYMNTTTDVDYVMED